MEADSVRLASRWPSTTAAGVSASNDMALYLAAQLKGELAAQTIQLALEYDPAPPFEAGHPSKAPAAAIERLSNLDNPPPSN